MGYGRDRVTALAAGGLLAAMIASNSALARHTSPLAAAWVAHGIGAIAAALLLARPTLRPSARRADRRVAGAASVPAWAWLAGLPGALTVVLAAIAVNGPLALAGTIALMQVGQALFGLVCDCFGLFGIAPRRLVIADGAVVGLMLAGSALLLFGGA